MKCGRPTILLHSFPVPTFLPWHLGACSSVTRTPVFPSFYQSRSQKADNDLDRFHHLVTITSWQSISLPEPKAKFFKALNGILYRAKGFSNDMVIMHLIQSYSKPLLLYASECFNMTRSETSQLCQAWRRVYWKVFKVSTDEAIDLIQVSTGLSALDIELRHRRSSFVHKLSCSTNSIINALFALKLWTGWCFFSFPSSSRVFCRCIVFCLSLSLCLFATHEVNKDLYI